MKIVCDKKILSTALTNVSRAIATKGTVPILEGILISASDNHITLSGYDLEVGITTNISANVFKSGAIVLNARLFLEIVKRMPQDDISISVNNKNQVIISSGIAEFFICTESSSEYPNIPTLNNQSFININAGLLKEMIDQTIFAIAVNDSKPIHMGSLFECANNTLNIISVDGVRLALKNTNIDLVDNKSFVVPGKTLAEISKLIDNPNATIRINSADKYATFQIDEYLVTSRLLEGNFLDYKSSIPHTHSTQITVFTKALIDSIERTSLIIFDKLKAPIKLSLEENLIKFFCHSSTGDAYDELACELTGDTFEIGFNSKMILDALRVIKDEKIKILMNGPLSPMKIVPAEKPDGFIFLVLPVRLKAEDDISSE